MDTIAVGQYQTRLTHWDSPTANDWDSPTANRWDSPTANHWDSPTANHWDSPTANRWDSPTANRWDSQTADHWDVEAFVDRETKQIQRLYDIVVFRFVSAVFSGAGFTLSCVLF